MPDPCNPRSGRSSMPSIATWSDSSQHLDRQKRFLDYAAHQLRTPLTIMKTQIGVARRTHDTAEGETALAGVDDNLTAMSRLTNQLLTLGRVDHDRTALQSERVDLAVVAREAVGEAAPRALDSGVELVLQAETPCAVMASATLAREMIDNLIDNAIQHAGTGTTATISVRRDADMAMLVAEDDGAGVTEEELPGLFERFQRGRRSRGVGSGLGLSIVAEIARMSGGSAELATPSGSRGFRVEVRLPLAEPPDQLPPHAAHYA